MYFLEPMCQRKMFIFMLCILMNNKDLFDLIETNNCDEKTKEEEGEEEEEKNKNKTKTNKQKTAGKNHAQ